MKCINIIATIVTGFILGWVFTDDVKRNFPGLFKDIGDAEKEDVRPDQIVDEVTEKNKEA